MLALVLLGVVVAGAWLWWELCGGKWRYRYNLPPGPTPLPLLGNLLSLDLDKPWEAIHDAVRRYGPVVTFWFGPTPSIVVAELEVLKATFQGDGGRRFTDTPFNAIIEDASEGRTGLVYGDLRRYKPHHRTIVHHIKEHQNDVGPAGLARRSRGFIEEMIGHLKRRVEGGGGAAEVDMLAELNHLASNLILSFLIGRGPRRDTPELDQIQAVNYAYTQSFLAPTALLFNVWPSLTTMPLVSSLLGWDAMHKANGQIQTFYGEMVAEARKNWDGADVSCLVHRFFAEQKRRRETGDEAELFSDADIVSNIRDMVLGGGDMIKNNVGFALIYLLHHPECEERCQREIEEKVGRERFISLEDRAQLPYVQAVVYESQRLTNIVPINPFHAVSEPGVKIGEFDVPVGVPVHAEISYPLWDPSHFAEPTKFRPERFLDGPLPEAFLPFGIGTRRCPGEPKGRSELFLILANLLQAFRLSPSQPANLPSPQPILRNSSSPRPYTLILKSHNPSAK